MGHCTHSTTRPGPIHLQQLRWRMDAHQTMAHAQWTKVDHKSPHIRMYPLAPKKELMSLRW